MKEAPFLPCKTLLMTLASLSGIDAMPTTRISITLWIQTGHSVSDFGNVSVNLVDKYQTYGTIYSVESFLVFLGESRMIDFYNKRNERKVAFKYPVGGNRNILRKVEGVKLASFTGPGGRGITVQELDGKIRSVSVRKIVQY